MWVNTIDFPSLECSKLYLTIEAKIITLSGVVLNVWEELFKTILINGGK